MFCQPLSFSGITKQLRSGQLDLVEFINKLCDRIDQVEPKVRALIPEDHRRERLLQEAQDLLKRFPAAKSRPHFFGIPIGVKDLFRVDGFSTCCGSILPAELFQGQEAACVQQLKAAGALILGKTVTTEFAFCEPGPTQNPNMHGVTPGGSSSGSAAAVAAGFTPFALGTQTTGSIIRPAAYCGVMGFKPSQGRISKAGVIPFSPSLDHVGFFVNSLDDCVLAASVLCDCWCEDVFVSQASKPLVIGVPVGKYLAQASPEILAHFEQMLQKFTAMGVVVKRVPLLDQIESVNKSHHLVIAAEIARVHASWFPAYKNLYRERTIKIIEEGLEIPEAQLAAALANRLELREKVETVMAMEGIDLWVSPSTKTMPPKGLTSTGSPLMNLPWTYIGLPTITIPTGKMFGIQFCGSFNQDELMLRKLLGSGLESRKMRDARPDPMLMTPYKPLE